MRGLARATSHKRCAATLAARFPRSGVGVRLLPLLGIVVAFVATVGCSRSNVVEPPPHEVNVDLDSLRRRGTIRVVTDYNSFNYFSYKGMPVGFQYELLSSYAKYAGLEMELVPDNTLEGGYAKLEDGRADILASTLVADSSLLPPMILCEPYGQSRIVVVGRGQQDGLSLDEWLNGDTVHVMDNSFYSAAMTQFQDTADVDVTVIPVKHYDAEQLVGMVAEGEIAKALSLENVARASMWYHDSLSVGPALTEQLDLAWGVRVSAPALAEDISDWLRKFKKTTRFKRIHRKYVIDPREHHSTAQSVKADTYSSKYESIIKSIAVRRPYDWYLVSSIVYQESHFNPNATSWAGAVGLMQLMPETAERFGVVEAADPEQSIRAGYEYLLWLDARLVGLVPDARERVKFVLAAYNVGLGHVMDAIRLARKFGKKDDVWDANVETALLLKANPAYYSDPVVKHGVCRGTETVAYVRNVILRASAYRKAYK